jgi:hypothetical protein
MKGRKRMKKEKAYNYHRKFFRHMRKRMKNEECLPEKINDWKQDIFKAFVKEYGIKTVSRQATSACFCCIKPGVTLDFVDRSKCDCVLKFVGESTALITDCLGGLYFKLIFAKNKKEFDNVAKAIQNLPINELFKDL